jgi:hypothetical protein
MYSSDKGVKACCFPFGLPETDLSEQFPELPKEFPPYYVCNLSKQNTENNNIDGRREAFIREGEMIEKGDNLGYEISPSATWCMKSAPKQATREFNSQEVNTPDFVNLGGRGDVFYGYARNVDVESDLKRINFLDDKCFDNNYKINPNSNKTSLYRYKDIILKDHIKAQDNTYRQWDLSPKVCLDTKNKNMDKCYCPYQKDCDNFFYVGDGFNNDPGRCFPPEQLFNTSTKRRLIYPKMF